MPDFDGETCYRAIRASGVDRGRAVICRVRKGVGGNLQIRRDSERDRGCPEFPVEVPGIERRGEALIAGRAPVVGPQVVTGGLAGGRRAEHGVRVVAVAADATIVGLQRDVRNQHGEGCGQEERIETPHGGNVEVET